MKGFDALCSEVKSFQRRGGDACFGVGDFLGGDANIGSADVEAIEASGEFEQRLVAARDDIGDDFCDSRADVGGSFALGA